MTVTNILDGLGRNVRTNFSTAEVKTLATIAAEIDDTKIKRISLVDEKKPVVTTGSVGAASVVLPIDGLFEYDGIKRYLAQQIIPASNTSVSSSISSEDAYIDVYNGSDKVGVAGVMANRLIEAGLPDGNVTTGDVPTKASYGDFVWFDLSQGGASQTKAKLQSILGRAPMGIELPSGVRSDADFVIIVGNGTN
ncbi:hypothetical protein B7Z17_03275 [Candidatus Saccharibacteria bacterium 32-49-10]|nr:MAG: hypothetical protein B7Z17_03275 [Candidatus Saccharibacteria bacterium 32-49-10]